MPSSLKAAYDAQHLLPLTPQFQQVRVCLFGKKEGFFLVIFLLLIVVVDVLGLVATLPCSSRNSSA